MKLAVVVVALTGCFAQTPVIRFGEGKTKRQVQQEEYAKATPPALVTTAQHRGDIHVAKIRVWADDDFRAQNIRWQHTFEDQLGYANEVLGPMFGIRLVAEYREWRYHAGGNSMYETLDALARQDAGSDVFAVVGLTSALGLVSATFDLLGVARLPGRHMVLRGYADVQERLAFDQYFRDLSADAREQLYITRRRHKSAAILLHELGHNLGAQHDPAPDTIMSDKYSNQASSFSDAARERIVAMLDHRLGRKTLAASAPKAHPTLVIQINDGGERLVGGRPVDDATLDELLKLSAADDANTELVVRATRKVPRDSVQKLMDRAKAAGITKMSLAVGYDDRSH